VAVVCLESVDDEAERRNLQQRLSKTHTIVDITRQQARLGGQGGLCSMGACAEVLHPAASTAVAVACRLPLLALQQMPPPAAAFP